MIREEAYRSIKENLCAMCAYGSQSMESCDIRSCDNRDAIKVLEQEPRWIPVSERLPEIQNYSDNYLVTLKSGGVHIGMFVECNGKHWWTHYDDVVAWMPLPEPYKAETEAE